ncbi:hypothetical protein, partial [Candidatus Mycobacterium methanotrophicum]|uniref:hypothetical protein n=1 Tax=Candidatus Mycobacterium methanotrophicum TaxID=2943498 RepID=UPI002104EF4E
MTAPPAAGAAGATATQLPLATLLNWPGVTSLTFVVGLKSTAAVPSFSVTCIALPDTDAISPWTCCGALADAGDDVAGGCALFDLFDELHAPTASAVALATARTANPVSRAGLKLSCIEIL